MVPNLKILLHYQTYGIEPRDFAIEVFVELKKQLSPVVPSRIVALVQLDGLGSEGQSSLRHLLRGKDRTEIAHHLVVCRRS